LEELEADRDVLLSTFYPLRSLLLVLGVVDLAGARAIWGEVDRGESVLAVRSKGARLGGTFRYERRTVFLGDICNSRHLRGNEALREKRHGDSGGAQI